MEVKIIRSFSKKVQVKQFEPIDSFCSMETVVQVLETEDENKMGDVMTISAELDKLCRDEVEKTLALVSPPKSTDTVVVCEHCGGVMEGKSKDGLCSDECRKQVKYKLENYKKK